MSRSSVVRYVWLLMISIMGGVFAPLAHDHDALRGPLAVRVAADAVDPARDVAPGGDTDPAEQITDTCLLCAHVAAQPAMPADPGRAARTWTRGPAERSVRPPPPIVQAPSWWRPALRAPPVFSIPTNS